MSAAPVLNYITKKLAKAQQIVKALSAVQAHVDSGLLKPVENSVLSLLKPTHIWQQDELVCTLEGSDFAYCVEKMLCVGGDDYDRDNGATHDAVSSMYDMILAACPLTQPVRDDFLLAERVFAKNQAKYEREQNEKPCGCRCGQWCRKCQNEYDEEEDDDDDDEDDTVSGTLLRDTIDDLPLVQKLAAEFGGDPWKKKRKAEK